MGQRQMKKLEGLALGFIVRKIMNLKEAKNRVQFVRDHDQRQFRETFNDKVLMMDSRKTACRQLIHFVRSLQKGGWVTFAQEMAQPRPISRNLDIENKIEKARNA